MVIWVTGLSGAGKTTLCEAIIKRAKPTLPTLLRLDGDVLRAIADDNLGYAVGDRVKQIRRMQALALEMEKQDFIVLVAALYASDKLLAWNRENFAQYFEIYVNTPMDELKRRDPKGLYTSNGAKGEVVGVDIPWNAPRTPDLEIDGSSASPDALAVQVLGRLDLAGTMAGAQA